MTALFAGDAWTADLLAPIGGPGGGVFHQRCAYGELLRGFELRVGDDVDALRPMCVTAYGPSEVSVPSESRWHGGTGGSLNHEAMCPENKPIVIGMDVDAEGLDTVIVNSIGLHCGVATAIQAADSDPNRSDAGFSGPQLRPIPGTRIGFGFGFEGRRVRGGHGGQFCPAGQVAVGVHGRSGIWLDAVGLLCDEPQWVARDPVPMPPPPKKTIAEQVTKSALTQASKTAAARTGIATSTVKVKPSAAYGIGAAGAAAPPATPPVVVPGPVAPVTFSPPLLEDNAQLWACVDAAAGEAEAGVCTGEGSAQAYCQRRNAQRGPAVLIADAQPGIPVRSVSGDVCADACKVVAELQCDQ